MILNFPISVFFVCNLNVVSFSGISSEKNRRDARYPNARHHAAKQKVERAALAQVFGGAVIKAWIATPSTQA